MNQARNRTAGNALLMHTASMATSGWPGSCNTGIRVTSAELASPAHAIRPSLWVVLSRSLHVKALEFGAFVIRAWENTIRACRLACLRSHVLRAYWNFESKQAILGDAQIKSSVSTLEFSHLKRNIDLTFSTFSQCCCYQLNKPRKWRNLRLHKHLFSKSFNHLGLRTRGNSFSNLTFYIFVYNVLFSIRVEKINSRKKLSCELDHQRFFQWSVDP